MSENNYIRLLSHMLLTVTVIYHLLFWIVGTAMIFNIAVLSWRYMFLQVLTTRGEKSSKSANHHLEYINNKHMQFSYFIC